MGVAIRRCVRTSVRHRQAVIMTQNTAVRAEVAAVVLDVRDLERETAFWSALLGSTVLDRGSGWADVAVLGVGGPVLTLTQARPRRRRRHRGGLHLDVVVVDFEAAVGRAVALGASAASPVAAGSSQVLADPEGHRFCLVQRGAAVETQLNASRG